MSDYRIYRSTFEAGHFIKGHPKCGVQHGHSYHLNVFIKSNLGEWEDFAQIKNNVDNFVQKQLDHQFLGNQSAEQISDNIANYLAKERFYSGYLELYETEKFGVVRQFGSER